jgi:hypothetical protein
MRILEFGPTPVVKTVYPEQTFYVGTGMEPSNLADVRSFDFGFGRIRQTRSLLDDADFDAVFVTRPASQRDGLSIGLLLRLLLNRRAPRRGNAIVRSFGDRMLRLGTRSPMVLFDPSDAPFVPRHMLWLWRRADRIFKRELPLDRWRVFMRTVHPDVPTPRFRMLSRYRAILDKVRPMSLGLSRETEIAIPTDEPEKTTDVFFAGARLGNSYLREAGLRELLLLREAGLSIDMPVERMPREEFYRRCQRARLVWSPEGLGHDAFRHYEAAACSSVPLISRPPIYQYAPFCDGESAFFYDPESGGLTKCVQRALKDRDRLTGIGRAARAHALQHHSQKARVDHMLASLSPAPPTPFITA